MESQSKTSTKTRSKIGMKSASPSTNN